MVDQVIQSSNAITSVVMNLAQDEAHETIQGLFNEVIIGPPFEAHLFSDRLDRLVKEQRIQLAQVAPQFLHDYEQWVAQTLYYSLPFHSDNKVQQLIKENSVEILRLGFDLREQIRIFLARHISLEDRNELRKQFIVAMESSEELLGGSIPGGTGAQVSAGTLGAWLTYRNRVLGQVTDTDLVKETSFLSQDRIVATLAPEKKKILEEIFKVYRWLHYSSLWQEGFEDRLVIKDTEGIKILADGAMVDVDDYGVAALYQAPVSQTITTLPNVNQNKNAVALKTVPFALKSPEPALVFNMEDEEEIDKIRNQMATNKLPIANTLEQNLRLLAEEVIAEHNFQFKDDVSRRRFVQLFVSYMKDVRDLIEVKEVLLKSTTAGGLGLSSDKVEVVADIFKKLHAQLPQRIKDWARLAPESRIENLESRKPEITSQTLKPLSKPVVAAEKPPVQPAPAIKASQDQLAEWRQELLAEIAKTGVSPKTKPAIVKPKLVDVQAPPRVLGPIEELKTMKLVDFRRQGTTVAEVIGKILAKVQLIGETGIGRRLQAVRAWQASPVYQMYLTIGRESIEQAKSAGDVITARQSAGQETLTLAEFESVADLNQKLRF